MYWQWPTEHARPGDPVDGHLLLTREGHVEHRPAHPRTEQQPCVKVAALHTSHTQLCCQGTRGQNDGSRREWQARLGCQPPSADAGA